MDMTLVRMVISTLNCIEVKGKDNLDKLLGCINVLETFVQIGEKQAGHEAAEKEEVNG